MSYSCHPRISFSTAVGGRGKGGISPLHMPQHNRWSEASSPTLMLSWSAHLLPQQWGEFYYVAQEVYRAYCPKSCSW